MLHAVVRRRGGKIRSGAGRPPGSRDHPVPGAGSHGPVHGGGDATVRGHGASVEAAQAGASEVNRKTIGFAEMNVNAAFEFAQQLVRARTRRRLSGSAGILKTPRRADEQP